MKKKFRKMTPFPEQAAIANLILMTASFLTTSAEIGAVVAPATTLMGVTTIAAVPLAALCWRPSNQRPGDPMQHIATTGAVVAVHMSLSLWAIGAAGIYQPAWLLLAAGTVQAIALVTYWKLFRRTTLALKESDRGEPLQTDQAR